MTAPQLSERAFQSQVVHLAKLCGWSVYHSWTSIKSEPGWPDLVIVRGTKILFRELKRETGQLTKDQTRWLLMLKDAGCDVDVWRPSMWPQIKDTLNKIEAKAPWDVILDIPIEPDDTCGDICEDPACHTPHVSH